MLGQLILSRCDILHEILLHATSVRELADLCLVCHAFRKYLVSTSGGRVWLSLARRICGDEHVSRVFPGTHNAGDARYMAILLICPWLSVPRVRRFGRVARAQTEHIYREVDEAAILDDGRLQLTVAFSDEEDEVPAPSVRLEFSLIPQLTTFYTIHFGEHKPWQWGRSENQIPMDVLDALHANRILPDDLVHEINRRKLEYGRMVWLHQGAFAIYSEATDVTDIYIYSADCLRLLRRIHVPRSVDRVRVLGAGPYLVLLYEDQAMVYAPCEQRLVRLRSRA